MKGSSRSGLKEENMVTMKSRIGTRSTGRPAMRSSRSPRTVTSATSSSRSPLARSSRSLSPGNPLISLRTKRARLEKEKETLRTTKRVDTTPKHASPASTDVPQAGTQAESSYFQSSEGNQSSQNTPKGAGIRTRLSTGSIHMNGTMTISAAKEKAEMEQIMKQIAQTDGKGLSSSGKKRSVQLVAPPLDGSLSDHPPPKKRKIGRNDGSGEDNRNDYFCWLCHKEGTLVCCELCPRVYHTRCLGLSAALPQDWVCPECEKIMRAECVDTRSKSMEMLTIDQLCTLLKYALERMKHAGSEPFQKPVDLNAVPNYFDYIFHPMDITSLEKNIKKKMYGCTEALLADAKWVQHNCIIYNGGHSKLTSSAKMIIKICKHEMNEIELCPDCYLNSCVRKNDDWFSETCRVPHTLVWAKLKGYPFWPSKALREVDGLVDVRFFGAHDRSWVPVSQCFLLSKNIPTSLQKGKKNSGLDMAIAELNLHVKKLRERFGSFEYAPFRTPYDKTDSYKPIGQKPDASPTTSVPIVRLTQNRGTVTSISPSLSSHKPNILRKSAVAKIRNKYNAMVTLKKIDTTPEKAKRKAHSDGEVDCKEESLTSDCEDSSNSVSEDGQLESGIKRGPNKDSDEKGDLKSVHKDSETIEDKTKEKVIKKSFVSTNLIERIENKLKALEDEPVKDLTESCDITREEAPSIEEKVKPDLSEEFVVKEIEKIPKIENKQLESKVEEVVKEKLLESSEKSKRIVETTPQDHGEEYDENSSLEQKSVTPDKDLENMEPDKIKTENDIDKVSTDSYRKKLDTMIKSCKEKLGMENEDVPDIDSAVSDDEEDNDIPSSDDEDSVDGVSSGSEPEDSSEDHKETTAAEDSEPVNDKVVKEPSTGEESNVTSSCDKDDDKNSKDDGDKDSITDKHDKIDSVTREDSNADVEVGEGEKREDKSKNLTSVSPVNNCKKSEQVVAETTKKTADVSESATSVIEANKDDSIVFESKTVDDKESEVRTKSGSSSQTRSDIDKESKDRAKSISLLQTRSAIDKESEGRAKSVSLLQTRSQETALSECNLESQEKDPAKQMKSYSEKILDPFSGEFSDRTLDDDSDTDRLVIDLEESSPQKQQRSKPGEVTKTKMALKTSTSSYVETEKINVTKETEKVQRKETERTKGEELDKSDVHNDSSKNISGTKSVSLKENNQYANKRETKIVQKLPVSRRRSKETKNEKEGRLSNELEFKTHSKTTAENIQCYELTGMKQTKETDINKSNTTAQASAEVTQAVEDMDVTETDSVKIHDDISSVQRLHSDMPVNTDTCLPNKNFVHPPVIDIARELHTGGNLAEKFSQKLLKTIQSTMEDMYDEVVKEKSDNTSIDLLNTKLHQAKWDYSQELNELKHNFQLTLYEMKSGWESEKEQFAKALAAKHQAEKELLTAKHLAEKEQVVKETKKKQWCAQCGKEAIFYCCWNTSYCDYPCQQSHWPQHMHTCLQTNKDKPTTSSSATNQGEGQSVSQSASSVQVSAGPNVTAQTSVSSATPASESDPLKQLQDNLSRAIHREEEKRGEVRPGVSPKFNTPIPSPVMQNIRPPGPGGMMFNMPPQPGLMQQIQRTRFIGQQQMAMQVQPRSTLPQSQPVNPRMLFSQPLLQHAVYPVQVQPQQQLGGTILFQNAQQMSYGMPPRPY